MALDGYKNSVSFKAAAVNARSRFRATLTDLRNKLFMSACGSRYRDDDRFLDAYRELLLLFQKVLQHGGHGTWQFIQAEPASRRGLTQVLGVGEIVRGRKIYE